MITAESGINDGLALPIVLFPLLLMDAGGEVLRRSLGYLAWELLGALLVGWILGQVTGRVFRLMHRKGVAEAKSLTAATTALALFALATVGLLGADGILSVFIAGIILNKQMKEEHAEAHEHFQDAVDRSFTLPVFILLGIIAPFDLWISQGWAILVASLAIVAFRRIPAWIVLQAIGKPYMNRREGSFAGWFGPIGVAALFYAAVALQHGAPQDVWASVTLVIVLSTFVHGISGTPLTRRHGASSSCQTGAGPSATGRSNRT